MADYWQLTIDILQNDSSPIVDKPKLQEKYLTKPPFRYLHDIVTAVQSNTGFAPGLFSGEELDAKAIQDKDAKVNYLQKIIDVVSHVLNEPVPAKPLKIVAGLEPENTNVFLQMLGSACRVNNGADAVKRVLGGGAAATTAAAPAEAPSAAAARPSSRPSSQQRGGEDGAADTAAPAAAATKAKRTSDSKGDSKEHRSKDKDRDSGGKDRDARSREKPKERDTPPKASDAAKSSKTRSGRHSEDASAAVDAGAPRAELAPPAATMVRPQSARKAPPKPPTQPPAQPAAAATNPASGGSGRLDRRGTGATPPPAGGLPAQGGARPVTVMEEKAGGDSDDDVEVVHEAVPVAIGFSKDTGGERGVLVKNIMDAEKDLKKAAEGAAGATADEGSGGTGIILKRVGRGAAAAAAAVSGGGAAGAGAVRTTDTAAIQERVQKLCQSTHPLAKSMDYLQEDIENMAKEYRFWQMEKRTFRDKLSTEQRLQGDNAAAEAQLADLNGQVKQARDRIMGIKAQIIRNDETVNKLLSMAVGR